MSYSGPPQQQQPYGSPQGVYPPPAKQGKSAWFVAAVIVGPLLALLLIVVVLSRVGVIDDGPFAKKAPKVPPITQWPAAAGGLYKTETGDQPDFGVLAGSNYEWQRSALYSNIPPGRGNTPDDPAEYMVYAYGSLYDIKDVMIDPKEVTKVGSGTCATTVVGQGVMWRVCGVNRGSIVVTVTGKYFGRDDQKLVGYANAIIEKVS
jgi:hypothetical protein